MFVPLEPLLEASSAQQACQRLQEPAGSSNSSSGSNIGGSLVGSYTRPLDGSCPLTGVPLGRLLPLGHMSPRRLHTHLLL